MEDRLVSIGWIDIFHGWDNQDFIDWIVGFHKLDQLVFKDGFKWFSWIGSNGFHGPDQMVFKDWIKWFSRTTG